MINNVINIIDCNSSNKINISSFRFFPEIEGLLNLDVKKINELYEDILIDTEVGYYFSQFLEEILKISNLKDVSTINNYLQDLKK